MDKILLQLLERLQADNSIKVNLSDLIHDLKIWIAMNEDNEE